MSTVHQGNGQKSLTPPLLEVREAVLTRLQQERTLYEQLAQSSNFRPRET